MFDHSDVPILSSTVCIFAILIQGLRRTFYFPVHSSCTRIPFTSIHHLLSILIGIDPCFHPCCNKPLWYSYYQYQWLKLFLPHPEYTVFPIRYPETSGVQCNHFFEYSFSSSVSFTPNINNILCSVVIAALTTRFNSETGILILNPVSRCRTCFGDHFKLFWS